VVQDATHNSAYEKYIKNLPDAGALTVNEEGEIMSSVPADPSMVEMLRKPETGETRNLQEEIESRRPTLEDLQRGPGKGRS